MIQGHSFRFIQGRDVSPWMLVNGVEKKKKKLASEQAYKRETPNYRLALFSQKKVNSLKNKLLISRNR